MPDLSAAPLTDLVALGPQWLDPTYLLSTLGPWVLPVASLFVFAECGLLFGFFLPGDSLLFTAGLFVASGVIATPLWLVCLLLVIAAIVGNLVGYGIGRAAGPTLLERPDGRFWRRAWVHRTEEFVQRHGTKALLLGRFVPIVRTVITAVAGVGRMPAGRFALWSSVGGVVWVVVVTAAGYLLGGVAVIRDHVELMIVAIVVVSLIPVVVEALRSRRAARATAGSRS